MWRRSIPVGREVSTVKPELSLSTRCAAAIVAHAHAEAPRECCGMLIGRGMSVVEAAAARNLADLPTRFLIDPQDHIAAIRGARARGLDVIGFYHSHPHSAAAPSPTDLKEASYPDHFYLSVSLEHEPPEMRCFRLHDGNFHELGFVTSD